MIPLALRRGRMKPAEVQGISFAETWRTVGVLEVRFPNGDSTRQLCPNIYNAAEEGRALERAGLDARIEVSERLPRPKRPEALP